MTKAEQAKVTYKAFDDDTDKHVIDGHVLRCKFCNRLRFIAAIEKRESDTPGWYRVQCGTVTKVNEGNVERAIGGCGYWTHYKIEQ